MGASFRKRAQVSALCMKEDRAEAAKTDEELTFCTPGMASFITNEMPISPESHRHNESENKVKIHTKEKFSKDGEFSTVEFGKEEFLSSVIDQWVKQL